MKLFFKRTVSIILWFPTTVVWVIFVLMFKSMCLISFRYLKLGGNANDGRAMYWSWAGVKASFSMDPKSKVEVTFIDR